MRVFVAMFGDGYGHNQIEGIYSTRDMAQLKGKWVEDFELDDGPGDMPGAVESRIRLSLDIIDRSLRNGSFSSGLEVVRTLLNQALQQFY